MAELRSVGSPFGRRASDARDGWTQARAVLRVAFVVAALVGALWLVYALRSVILLLVLSAFFAYVLAPLVRIANRPFRFRGRERQLSAALAIGVVYLVLFGLLAVTVAVLLPRFSQQVTQIATQAPAYLQTLEASGRRMAGVYDRIGVPPNARQVIDRTFETLAAGVEGVVRRSLGSIVGGLEYLPWLVLIPVLGFFLLKDAETFRRGALALLPPGRTRTTAVELFDRVNFALAAYIRAQLLACVLVGLVVGCGFALMGVPYPVILGVTAGLAEFVPLVGPLVVALAAALVAAVKAPMLAVWVLVFLAVLRFVEDYVVYPRLVGHGMHLHPLAIIVAVLAGAELAGVAGVFLSVPAIAVLSAAYRQYQESSGTESILGAPAGAEAPVVRKSG